MTIGTIQQDVSQEGTQVVSSPQQLQRSRDMEQIMARSDEQLERQIAGNVETTVPEVRIVDDPSQYRVRVKVDGKEQELLVADVVTGFQKNEVASERLRQASERTKELDAREQSLKALEAQIQAQTANPSQGQRDGENRPAADDDVRGRLRAPIAKALEMFVDGDAEQAADLLTDSFLNANKGREVTTPAVDPQQIAQQVRQSINTEQAWNSFVQNNPEFAESFDNEGNQIISPEREYGDFVYMRDFKSRVDSGELSYQEALNQTAAHVKKVMAPSGGQQLQQQEASGSVQRQQRKAAIDNIAVAAGARNGGPVEEQEESHADIIKNMRKSRGLGS